MLLLLLMMILPPLLPVTPNAPAATMPSAWEGAEMPRWMREADAGVASDGGAGMSGSGNRQVLWRERAEN
jgi:hypothetical protein